MREFLSLTDEQREIQRVAREFAATHIAPFAAEWDREATYDALAAELDTQQIMDVVFTVGAYEVFAMAMRTIPRAASAGLTPSFCAMRPSAASTAPISAVISPPKK